LYREKDAGGGLCHGHISHLVHPKTLILDRLEQAKERTKNVTNTCSNTLAILKKKIAGLRRQIFFVRDKLHWQKKTSQLDKFNLSNHHISTNVRP